MATFLALQDEVQWRIRQRTDLTNFVKSKLNEAVLDVMLLVKPPEFHGTASITTVAEQPNYNIFTAPNPDVDTLAILSVSNLSTDIKANKRLRRGSYEEFDEMDNDYDVAANIGQPTKYFRYANEIILYNKVPDDNDGGNYSIRVRTLTRPTEMSADADEFPLELEWVEPVVLRATEKMFNLLGNAAREAAAQAAFANSVGFIIERIQSIEDTADHDATMRPDTHLTRTSGRTAR